MSSSSSDAPRRVGAAAGRTGKKAAPGHCFLQVGGQHLRLKRIAGEVAVQEALVLALGDDPFDERCPFISPFLLLAFGGEQGGEPVAFGRHGEGKHACAECFLAARERAPEVSPRLIELGDDDRARHGDGGAFAPEQPGSPVDRVEGAYDEQGRVSRA